jgi:hypothetical protein
MQIEQRAEADVVIEPPGFGLAEGGERGRAPRAGSRLRALEPREGGGSASPLA